MLDRNHWVTVSIFNTETEDIIMYDPKYSSCSETTQDILAQIVNTDRPSFSVKIASVTKQSGSSDCGLFAIAHSHHTHSKWA